MGCHFLPRRICRTQGSNPRLLHWQADSLPLSHLILSLSCSTPLSRMWCSLFGVHLLFTKQTLEGCKHYSHILSPDSRYHTYLGYVCKSALGGASIMGPQLPELSVYHPHGASNHLPEPPPFSLLPKGLLLPMSFSGLGVSHLRPSAYSE